MKVCPAGAEFFHADGRTDATKIIVDFRIFAEAPKYVLAVFRACHYTP
jgi:hypothetical protein